MSTNVAELHDSLEGRTPDGVGVAISLRWLERQAKQALDAMSQAPRPGLNEKIPLPATTLFQAAFRTSGAQFGLDPVAHTVTLSLEIWLHVTGDANSRIISFPYQINAPILTTVDQSTFEIFLAPGGGAANLGAQTYAANADALLIASGYVQGGTADRARFEREIVYPFLWLNARGLAAVVFRSLPLPQLLTKLGAIRPVVPINSALDGNFLLAWADRAAVVLPNCGEQKPLTGSPATNLVPSLAQPTSPIDHLEPPFAIYFGGNTLLDWHAEALLPAVMITQTQEGFIGWRYDASIGLRSLTVSLQPAMNGGAIAASANLALVGVVSAWMNGPCGLRIDLVNAAIQADGTLTATAEVFWQPASYELKAALDVHGDIDRGSVNINTGGLIGSIIGDVVEWLYRIGVIKIDTQYRHHSESMLLDTATIMPLQPSLRVGRRSALISCLDIGGD